MRYAKVNRPRQSLEWNLGKLSFRLQNHADIPDQGSSPMKQHTEPGRQK
jgi:hypothetical protein